MNHYPILAYVSVFCPLLPIVTGFFMVGMRKQENIILILFLVSAFTIDSVTTMFIKDSLINLGLMHVYVFMEFLFIMFIVSSWQESQKMKNIFRAIYVLFILFWFCAKFTFEPFNGLYYATATVSQVVLALAAGYTLFVVIGNRVQSLFNRQQFWVLLSIVVYYTGTLAIIALQGILIHYSREDVFLAASINWSLKIIFNILITVGFLCPQTQP